MVKKQSLARSMTEKQFDNGYWYTAELKAFAKTIDIPSASRLRKDQLEKAIKAFLRTGVIQAQSHAPAKSGIKDVERGLRPDLAIVNYTSNKVTKAFIVEQARKIDPSFKPKSGTRYLLNRWREEQIARGRRLTYGELAQQALKLNRSKTGPLRIEHGRYINFISDFMAANPGARHSDAVRAWAEVKRFDCPKIFEAWKKYKRGLRGNRR